MATNVASVINNLIRWGGMVLLAYFMFRTVQSLAGQTTSANIGLRLFGEVRLSDVIAFCHFRWRRRDVRPRTTAAAPHRH